MSDDSLACRFLTEVAAEIRTRKLSPVEVTEAILRRIERLAPSLHSYATLTADLALEQARTAEREIASGRYRGPLHGIPIAVKDLCCTRGIRTACGMTILADHHPEVDATVVERFRLAGAVLLGKLQMTEGAFADHHPAIERPRNPWHPDHWAGASSSGSGSATAAGLCYGSLGSDTGGSIRFPSAANGITGLKPTWGRVSRHGVLPLSESLDHIGPMARSSADAAALLSAIAGPDAKDPTTLPAAVPDYGAALAAGVLGARGFRIGIDESFNSSGVEPAVAELTAAAADVFADLGAELRPIEFPAVERVLEGWMALSAVEAAVAHATTYPARADAYGPALASFIESGRQVGALDLARHQIERDRFKGRLMRLFAEVDLILMPAMYLAGPTFERMSQLADPAELAMLLQFTAPLDMSGSPTITLPCGFSAAGLPVGCQLVGPHLAEDLLLRAGHAYQQATTWHTMHPDL